MVSGEGFRDPRFNRLERSAIQITQIKFNLSSDRQTLIMSEPRYDFQRLLPLVSDRLLRGEEINAWSEGQLWYSLSTPSSKAGYQTYPETMIRNIGEGRGVAWTRHVYLDQSQDRHVALQGLPNNLLHITITDYLDGATRKVSGIFRKIE